MSQQQPRSTTLYYDGLFLEVYAGSFFGHVAEDLIAVARLTGSAVSTSFNDLIFRATPHTTVEELRQRFNDAMNSKRDEELQKKERDL